MALANPSDPAIGDLVPVVRYAVQRRIATSSADYWDYATLLELAAIQNDLDRAEEVLPDVMARVLDETWKAETTARNLGLIRHVRATIGEDVSRLSALIAEVAKVR